MFLPEFKPSKEILTLIEKKTPYLLSVLPETLWANIKPREGAKFKKIFAIEKDSGDFYTCDKLIKYFVEDDKILTLERELKIFKDNDTSIDVLSEYKDEIDEILLNFAFGDFFTILEMETEYFINYFKNEMFENENAEKQIYFLLGDKDFKDLPCSINDIGNDVHLHHFINYNNLKYDEIENYDLKEILDFVNKFLNCYKLK